MDVQAPSCSLKSEKDEVEKSGHLDRNYTAALSLEQIEVTPFKHHCVFFSRDFYSMR